MVKSVIHDLIQAQLERLERIQGDHQAELLDRLELHRERNPKPIRDFQQISWLSQDSFFWVQRSLWIS